MLARLFAVALAMASAGCATTSPDSRASDVQELLRLHEQAMQAHRESSIDLLLAAEGDEYVIASRGEVSKPGLAARKAFLGPYLAATRFSVYRDQVTPIAKVSGDGTLGWVIAQVEAKGEQKGATRTHNLEFVSAWIELYEKKDGRWTRVGNVSNFKG
jgi:hypothetical protein